MSRYILDHMLLVSYISTEKITLRLFFKCYSSSNVIMICYSACNRCNLYLYSVPYILRVFFLAGCSPTNVGAMRKIRTDLDRALSFKLQALSLKASRIVPQALAL